MLEGLENDAQARLWRPAAYAALGDKDEAFRLLFRMVEKHEDANVFIKYRSPVRQPSFRSALGGSASPDELPGEVGRHQIWPSSRMTSPRRIVSRRSQLDSRFREN